MALDAVREAFAELARRGDLLVLTGAGISAESGIPTFRGPEGYWTVGAREYHPMELATAAAFARLPAEVWGWYLYRRGVCRAAEPSAGHRAVADLARVLEDRLTLVTQNVDGLHARAGGASAPLIEIHGNIDLRRCARGCMLDRFPIPDVFDGWPRGRVPSEDELRELACPACGGPGRPHVLWFDECYDEALYGAESALAAARRADLLLVVGTSGATNLPMQIGHLALRRGIPVVDVNPDDGPFADLARASTNGAALRARAGDVLPRLARAVLDVATGC